MREPTVPERSRIPLPAAAAVGERLLSGDMIAVLAASSAVGFALATFYLLPKFLVEELVATPSQVGLVMSSYGAATLVGACAVALAVDRFARRDMIATASVVTALSSLAFVFVDRIGPALLLLRSLQGLCFAVVLTAVGVLVTELAPAAKLSQAFGLSGASMLIMSAIAPPVAESLAVRFGWHVVFGLAASAAALGALLSRGVHEPAGASRRAWDGPRARGCWEVLRRRVTFHYALVTAAVGSAFGVMFTFEQPFVLSLGRDRVGGFFIAYSIAAVAVRALFGGVADRFGRLRVAVVSLHLYTVAVLAMAAAGPGLVELVAALLGIAHGVFFPAFNALVIGRSPSRERGILMSVFTGAFYGGTAVGVSVLGVVAEVAGYRAVFAISAAITALAGVLLVFSDELAAPQSRQ